MYIKWHKKINYFKKSRARTIISIAASLLVILEIGILTSQNQTKVAVSEKVLAKFAGEIVSLCKDASYRPSCYDKEIPKLMDKISMEDAFDVIKIVQSKDSSYSYCHVLGHKLSAKEVQKNPKNWKNVLTRCPFGECANGCQHGLVQEVFRAEYLDLSQLDKLEKELTDVCEPRDGWNPSPFERAHCYHGLGHALLYSSPDQIPRLLNICDNISSKNEVGNLSPLCYEGLFMQIFQPLEPEDFALVKDITPKKDDLLDFCLEFEDDKKRNACWNQGWAVNRAETTTLEGLTKHCENPTFEGNENRCYNTLFHVIGQHLRFDVNKIDEFCSKIRPDLMGDCYSNAASSIMQSESAFIKKAIEMCKIAGEHDKDIGDYCYDYLVKFSTYNYNHGSKEFIELCDSLPKNWKNKCYGEL